MKTLLRWTNATTLVRGVCVLCVVLILLGLFAPQVLRPLQRLGLSSQRPSTHEASAASSVSDPDASPPSERTVAGEAALDQNERTPFIDALGGLVDQNERIFGPVQAQLQADLEQANAILLDTKRTNQAALRQANRRIRLPGRSPNLLLVIFEGLSCDSLHCYHESAAATPGFDRLAAHGARFTQYAPTETTDTDWTGLFGETASDSSRAGNHRPPAFASLLWQSGYATALIGDVSKPPAPPSELGFDHWFGSPDQRAAIEAAIAHISQTARQRPVATIVLLNGREQSVQAQDETVSLLLARLEERRLTDSTALVVVGIPPREATSRVPQRSARPPLVPGFAVCPHQIPPGRVIAEPTTLADVACTLLAIADISQRPARLKGTSRWESWRNGTRSQ